MRDLKKQRPEVVGELLPVARKRAASDLPSNRKARWTALVSYLEAGAPDPGDSPDAELARAVGGDERSARWALGYLPNELMEHAPRPFPYLRDRAVVAWASSANESVWSAAVAAIEKQITQLPIEAPEGELAAGVERRAHTAKLLAPHLAALRAGLAPRVCRHPETIAFLADANDPGIDDELLPCVEGKPEPNIDFLTTLFHSCLDHHGLGFSKTGAALAKTARPGEDGRYARRVAAGCVTGQD